MALNPDSNRAGNFILALSAFLIFLASGFGAYALINYFNSQSPQIVNIPTPTPTPPPIPEPTSYSTPQPPNKAKPTPEPTPPPSVKQIGENQWRVTVTGTEWFDSGIPFIANQYVRIDVITNGHCLIKTANKIFFTHETKHIEVSEIGGNYILVDYDFQDTLKFKIDEENWQPAVSMIIEVHDGGCPLSWGNSAHQALHKPFIQRAETMKAKIGRR